MLNMVKLLALFHATVRDCTHLRPGISGWCVKKRVDHSRMRNTHHTPERHTM